MLKKTKTKALRKNTEIDVLANVWPHERDYILRPERLKYIRRILPIKHCVFCVIRKAGVKQDSLCVYQSRHAMVVLNKYPYNSGHVMVLPLRHCGDLADLTLEEHEDVMSLVRDLALIVKKEYQVEGLNIGLNMGSVAGAGIPSHLHWHIIPRWHGDTNFFPLIAETKVIPESLEQTYKRYAKHFKVTNRRTRQAKNQ